MSLSPSFMQEMICSALILTLELFWKHYYDNDENSEDVENGKSNSKLEFIN